MSENFLEKSWKKKCKKIISSKNQGKFALKKGRKIENVCKNVENENGNKKRKKFVWMDKMKMF